MNNRLYNSGYSCFVLLVLLIPAVIFSVSGCSLHDSQVEEPLIDMPPAYSDKTRDPSPPVNKWWIQYDNEELNILMEEAFLYNLDIAQAYERLQQSMATVRIVNSSRGVNLNVEASGGRGRQPAFAGPVTEDAYTLSAAASYEIDLWGKLKSRTAAAQFDALAAVH